MAEKRQRAAKLKCCAITQFLEEKYWAWPWTDAERKALADAKAGNVCEFGRLVGQRLQTAGLKVREAHVIVHNQDTRKVWDEASCQEVIDVKAPHIHMAIRFEDDAGGTVDDIGKACGLASQYVEKAGRGRYGWDNLLSYLIHAKDAEKFQYDPKSVVSYVVRGEKTYMQHYTENKDEWAKGRAIKARQKAEANIDELETMILLGQVTKSQVMLTDEYFDVYARFKRRCDDAFAIYGDRKAYKTLQALQNGEFKLSVFFITGQAGSGKTRFAKAFADRLIRWSAENGEDTWQVCQTAATNPLDDYNGEEILLMDDVRGGSLSSSDWLKLLDPYNISPNSARYHNKTTACRVVIITSTKEPLEFFYYAKQIGGDRSEALDQFLRRIQSMVQVIRADDWMNTQYKIADGQPSDRYKALVPGTSPTAQVTLQYGFADDKTVDFDGAIQALLDKVEGNSNLKQEAGGEAVKGQDAGAPGPIGGDGQPLTAGDE